jgi:hypothetical protein
MSDSDEELNAVLRGDLPPPKKVARHKIIESDESDDEMPISILPKTSEKGKRSARVHTKGNEPVKRCKAENVNTFWEEVITVTPVSMFSILAFKEPYPRSHLIFLTTSAL